VNRRGGKRAEAFHVADYGLAVRACFQECCWAATQQINNPPAARRLNAGHPANTLIRRSIA